jgi:uncharacterized membrane protein YeaQ/YmgE (transglycosylase-associated protein family)
MFTIIAWLVFGLLVGLVAKMLHPGDEPVGLLPTIAIGVVGSLVGGGINWLLNGGGSPFRASGFIMSIIGGVITCAAWRYYNLKFASGGPKSFLNGRRK